MWRKGDINASDGLSHLAGLQLLILTTGIVKVAEMIGWIVENRTTCTVSWPYVVMLTMLGLGQMQYAWASLYEYKIVRWRFWKFLMACMAPLIYLISTELFIPSERKADLDLWIVYHLQIRVLAGLLGVAQIVNIYVNIKLHSEEQSLNWQVALRLVGTVPCAALIWFDPANPIVQWIAVPFLFVLLLVYCFRYTPPVTIEGPKSRGQRLLVVR